MHFVACLFASRAIAGQTIVGWAIGRATSIKKIALEENNSSIGEKPLNPVELRRKTKVEKIL